MLNGTTAYVEQEPWVQNESIKRNIIFNSSKPFDSELYRSSLNASGLMQDLNDESKLKASD